MHKRVLFYYLLLMLLAPLACNSNETKTSSVAPQEKEPASVIRDLDEIKKSGKLRALITYSGTSYFLYRGKTMGFEYEFLERLADSLGLKLELIVVKNMDTMLEELQKGNADIIAHGMTITNDRKKVVDFTDYLYLTHQVLVQKQPDNWREMKWSDIQKSLLHDAVELVGKTVSVRKNSSYNQRLQNLADEIGGEIQIEELSGELPTDDILKMVAEGKIQYSIADNNIASITASYHPILDIKVPVSLSQRIGWMVSKKSPKLLIAINLWLKKFKRSADYNDNGSSPEFVG